MKTNEWSQLRHDPHLDVGFLHAFYTTHAYPRHSHDYYVFALIERGVQSCTYEGKKDITLPGGLLLLNPGAVHTGEPADEHGFEYRALYPTVEHMRRATSELTGRSASLPFFSTLRHYRPDLTAAMRALHIALGEGSDTLECESRFLWLLNKLVASYGDPQPIEREIGQEQRAVQRAREYIDSHFAEGVSLERLADEVGLSPYYLLRVFRATFGMPPHAYLESVRVREAQRLLASGIPSAQVALATGFSNQGHFTNRFKRMIGVTPGQYAQQWVTG